jgi:hypothetical protein
MIELGRAATPRGLDLFLDAGNPFRIYLGRLERGVGRELSSATMMTRALDGGTGGRGKRGRRMAKALEESARARAMESAAVFIIAMFILQQSCQKCPVELFLSRAGLAR